MDDTDNVTKLGVKFKTPDNEERMLSIVPHRSGCLEHTYIIDPETDTVECSKCEKKFNPMFVLEDLATKESRWMRNGARYQEEMKRLSERTRTKCDHCGEMTRVSKR